MQLGILQYDRYAYFRAHPWLPLLLWLTVAVPGYVGGWRTRRRVRTSGWSAIKQGKLQVATYAMALISMTFLGFTLVVIALVKGTSGAARVALQTVGAAAFLAFVASGLILRVMRRREIAPSWLLPRAPDGVD